MFPLTLFRIFILVEHGTRSMPLVIEEYANVVGVFDIRSINDPAIAILHLTIQLALEDIPWGFVHQSAHTEWPTLFGLALVDKDVIWYFTVL